MKKIKYVCISDLHLGAPNSILTRLHPHIVRGRLEPNPVEPTASLNAFAAALKEFLPALHDRDDPPTLILLGDVLDLGFSPTHQVVMAFQRFVERIFPKNEPPLFAKNILFLPGNHDHSLWQSEKTQYFVNQIKRRKTKNVPDLVETTSMMAEPEIVCNLLTEVINEYSHLTEYSVKIAYPNIGFANQERVVFLHHGHFIESIYRMMSEIGLALFDEKMDNVHVSEIERINGTWIDFIWSSLGEVGSNAYSLYSLMQDGAALHEFTSSLAAKIENRLLPYLPMSGLAKVQELGLGITKGILDAAIGRASELERNSYQNVLSGDSLEGLKWYVNKVIRKQFASESTEHLPDDVSFIFGHTHKPFEDQVALSHYKYPVKIYNTGGWVTDIPKMVSTQGGSMVLIDDDLRVVSVRLFNDPVNDIMNPVTINGVGGFPDESNPFLPHLRKKLQEHEAIWSKFSHAVKSDIEACADLMQRQFFNPASSTPSKLQFD
ncbi:MAG: metallophosphoesterase [Cyclobacteriaceae bacterium]